MIKCEFRLAGDNTFIGTKEMEAIPRGGDEVELTGESYKVEDQPRDASSDVHTVWVRKVAD
jgi:hypothetical protein